MGVSREASLREVGRRGWALHRPAGWSHKGKLLNLLQRKCEGGGRLPRGLRGILRK